MGCTVRRRTRRAWVVGVYLAAAGTLHAQTPADIERLSWMAGSWHGTQGRVVMEEHWAAPSGGSMIGMHRDVEGQRTTGFEYARIADDRGTLVYYASPGGAPPTPFRAVEVGAARVVCENPEHDFPQRVIYWREGATLHARIEGTMNGTTRAEEWAWTSGRLAPR